MRIADTLRLAVPMLLSTALPTPAAAGREKATATSLDLEPMVRPGKAEMRVVERFPATILGQSRSLTLVFATMAPSYHRTADTIEDLAAEDDSGTLPLAGPNEAGQELVWQATRLVKGRVTLRYRVPAAPHDIPHGGPITYLQNSSGGLSGSFDSFLLAPKTDTSIDIAVRWHLPPGQQAVSNVQVGGFKRRMTFADLAQTLFVAGPLRHAPAPLSDQAVMVVGLGKPKAEIERSRQWFGPVFAAMRSAFQNETTDGFRIMVFSHDRQAFNSGTSRAGGFLFFVPKDQPLDDPKSHPIIAHEMVHSLVKLYEADADGLGDWYNEGIADYAAIIVPQAAGLYTPAEYLRIVNEEAAFYYLNTLRETPNGNIPDVKWSVGRAWSLGYSRGALYFANLDAALRNHGAGITVLGLVQKMNDLAKTRSIGPEEWEALLNRDAGPWAVLQWRSMLAGQLVRPVAGAFGNCLVAREIPAGHYDLGFTRTNLRPGGRIERVAPQSNADKAGLRDGDVVRETFVESDVDNQFDRPITLKVTRDGKPVDVTFAPRTGKEPAYRWFPRSGDVDRPCG